MKTITFRHSKALPRGKSIDRFSALVVLLPNDSGSVSWQRVPYGDRIKAFLKQRKVTRKAGETTTFDLPNQLSTHTVLLFEPETQEAFQRLTLAGKIAKQLFSVSPRKILIVNCIDEKVGAPLCEAFMSALLARCAELPSFKSTKPKPASLQSIHYVGLTKRIDTRRLLAEAQGNELARHLTLLPANSLTPGLYRREVNRIAKRQGWRVRFLDIAELKRKKAGAFLAVAQGSTVKDAGILHLSYRPTKSKGKPVTLVGKGICFDTGGVNVKSARYMQNMHEDMEGSAVALGTLLALTQLKVDFPVECWLALAQNHIGPEAYKPNDVVTATNGTTIEVVHTDAEGRMVLADTLSLASRSKPKLIIDYATLTGACVYSLSSRYSGAFTNRDHFTTPLIEAGRISGERVWPFPTDEDFDEAIESDIADVKQCALDGEADHIIAARFLQRFVGDVPWIHLDLSAGRNRGGLAHIPTATTGFGVRFTLELLLGNRLDLSQ